MSDAAKRNARNRRAGKSWEWAIRDGGRDLGIDTEHTRDSGEKDEGDLALRIDGKHIVVEAKNAKFEPGPFLNESELEAGHYAARRRLDPSKVFPVVFVKRRGKTSFLDGFALLSVREYLRLHGVSEK